MKKKYRFTPHHQINVSKVLQNKENRSGFKKSLFLPPIIWYNALTKGESQILKGDLL